MTKIKLITMLLLFYCITFSQYKNITFRFLKIDPEPCFNCNVIVNGEPNGTTTPNGFFELTYDTTKNNKFEIEVIDPSLKISKKFNFEIGHNKNTLKGHIIFFTLIRAYLNKDNIEKNYQNELKLFKKVGITDVFIPVFFDGKTIYPTKIRGIKGSNYDLLKDILSECKKLNIRAHASLNTLNWGNSLNNFSDISDYLMVNRSKEFNKGPESNCLFVSPAHPEVIRVLTELNSELVNNYPDLYGINYNFLRFKEGSYQNYKEEDFGFEKNIVNLFKENYGIDPFSISFDSVSNSPWMKWVDFKENLITNLLIKMVSAVKEKRKDIVISINLNPYYLFNRGKDFTCANAYDFEELIQPDNYFIEFSKKDLKNELRVLDFYLPSDNPFINDENMQQRKNAFIPLIKYDPSFTNNDLENFVSLFSNKGCGANFILENSFLLNNPQKIKIIQEIMFK